MERVKKWKHSNPDRPFIGIKIRSSVEAQLHQSKTMRPSVTFPSHWLPSATRWAMGGGACCLLS